LVNLFNRQLAEKTVPNLSVAISTGFQRFRTGGTGSALPLYFVLYLVWTFVQLLSQRLHAIFRWKLKYETAHTIAMGQPNS
jgi:hypothetical protein